MVYNNGTVDIVTLKGFDAGFNYYSALNGTANWIPQTITDGAITAPSIVSYPYVPGSPGGVHVVGGNLFGFLSDETEADGSYTWQFSDPCPPRSIFSGSTACSDGGTPSAVMNGGLLNIAVEDGSGNLSFWWQDSAGNFHQETVDTAANL
jgi:hypothetical protein